MRPLARMRSCAHMCSVHTTICGLVMRVCIHSLTRRLCAKTKVSSRGYKRAHTCLQPYCRMDALPWISARIHSNCAWMHMMAVCAHTAVGSCCGLGSALHTLSSASSLRATARSIYSHAHVLIDRRLRTDHQCGMPYVRAHVRARVDLAMWAYIGLYLL